MVSTWTYRARPVRVVDGDTLDLALDLCPGLGLDLTYEVRVRLRGIDTAETYGVSHDSAEYRRGVEQREFVAAWLAAATEAGDKWPVAVRTQEDARGKYGRLLARVARPDGSELTADLIEQFPSVEA